MIRNNELENENLKLYKKIFCRHLKELGIYGVVLKNYFHKHNYTFDFHVRNKHGSSDVISECVSTLWGPVNESFQCAGLGGGIKASLFLIKVITDKDFINVFSKFKYFVLTKFNSEINDSVKRELGYVSGLETAYWIENVTNADISMLTDIIYENGFKMSKRLEDKMTIVSELNNKKKQATND